MAAPRGARTPLTRVAIFGGTHGNELSGVLLARHWQEDGAEVQRPGLRVTPFISNPRAVHRGVRYVDRDLNRVFDPAHLGPEPPEDQPYEVEQAREIHRLFGAYDVILDLHNTTSNMGCTLILESSRDDVLIQMFRYIQGWRVSNKSWEGQAFLASHRDEEGEAGKGPGLRVGDIQRGISPGPGDLLVQVSLGPAGRLAFFQLGEQRREFPACSLEAYQVTGKVDYPRKANGEIAAVIHPSLQDRDWQPLKPGEPAFLTLDGTTIPFDGDGPVYPVFVNEAAYYEKGEAFAKTRKVTLTARRLDAAGAPREAPPQTRFPGDV
uniref:Aspartoacylase n=1 Tax=Monodelphis domestica TaxID=13616 RepID=A0A5F8GVW4_MONDO